MCHLQEYGVWWSDKPLQYKAFYPLWDAKTSSSFWAD